MSTEPTKAQDPCPECKGTGKFETWETKPVVLRFETFHERVLVTTKCTYCKGTGKDPTEPWGWDVEVEFINCSRETFHKQGTASKVRRWGIMKTLARKATLLKPYTRTEWIRAYGDSRVRM